MRSPFLTALLHPFNVFMVVITVIAGLISAWWLFPIGVIFWIIMVFKVARDPSLRINHQMQSRAPLAQRFQRYFERIERSQIGIFNSLASAPPKTRRTLQPIQVEIDAMTSQVYALCQRMTTLENYRVVSQSQTNLESDIQRIEQQIESASDPVVRHEYTESRRALQERLEKLQAVSTQLDRVEAQLLSLANEMDTMVTEVIRLQAMGPDAAMQLVRPLTQKLRGQAAELKTFERETVQI
ncbi:MAG: hypothetical protein JXB35_13690 [Anaerolineae bacterium]|nr:hypothetical protein [Anaerolineae bacterium]